MLIEGAIGFFCSPDRSVARLISEHRSGPVRIADVGAADGDLGREAPGARSGQEAHQVGSRG